MRASQRILGLLLVGLVISIGALFVTGGGVAQADGGPHGGYGATGGSDSGLPDQCAGCHRAHTAASQGQLLIASSPYALCLTCHNGTGSKLNVVDGVKIAAQYDAAVVSYDDDGDLRASVAPAASVWMAVDDTAVYTVVLRNAAGTAITAADLTVTETLVATEFLASDLSSADASFAVGNPDTIDVPAAVSGVYGTASFDLTVTSDPAAVAGDVMITSVTATDGTDTVVITVQSEVGTPSTDTTLNGGGFSFVNGTAITSRHNADPADASVAAWGYNATPANADTGVTGDLASALQCSSCHNPHGSANYRLLKETINSQTVVVNAWYSAAYTKDEGARGLEAGAPSDKYTAEYYGSEGTGGAPSTTGEGSIASLCGACHTAYPSSGAATATAGGHYRHATEVPYTNWAGGSPTNPETAPLTGFPALRLASNGDPETDTIVTCLTCHRAHGTSSTMAGWAVADSQGGLNPFEVSAAQTATSTSTLLYTDNRGMCQACHQWGN